MANKSNETDLVDTRNLPSEEDITEARHKVGEDEMPEISATERDAEGEGDRGFDDPFAMQMEPPKPGQTTIASLRERLAAFLVDTGVLWLLFWGSLFVFHKLTTHSWIGPVPTNGTVALFFYGIFLFLAFLYFFLLEAAFFATIGKFCCWMYVRRKDGRHAGALAIFIRNFFRIIECLTGGLLAWVPMELSRRHQRLGDMAAGTIVIKKHSASSHYYSLDAESLASAFGRLIAQLIDLALVLIWLLGYVMLINYQMTILSQWLVLLFPVVFVLFWTLAQLILETTPGLWLIGYTITHEDGGRLTFAGALLRVMLAPLDLLLGLPCMLLGLRKQKIGDMVAATLVSRQHRRWKGAIGGLVVIALSIGMVALGLFVNPLNNVFKAGPDFKLSFMPLVEGLPDWESASSATPPVITLRNFRFGVNDPNTRRTPPVYEPGETVYLLFEIYGYTRKDRLVWIQEDLMVQYPDGAIGLKQENVVDYHQIVKPGGGQIELTNNIALPPTAAPGTYVVTVTLRDALADNFTVTDTQAFTVKGPPVMTSPLEAPPPAPSSSPPSAAGEGQEGVSLKTPAPPMGEAAVPSTPTVPSSPIPVVPIAPTPPAPTMPTPETGAAPSGGFTVLPGPSIEPRQEAAFVPSIPVPPPTPPPPADQYGSKAVTPAPLTPTATPTTPIDPYGTKATSPSITVPAPPADRYGSMATPPPAPTAAAPVPSPAAPAIVEKTLAPADVYGKPVIPIAPAPKEKAKIAPKTEAAKQATPAAIKSTADQELKKAAEKELQKMTPAKTSAPASTPAKPAADIPSASAVKKESEQAPKAKKKKQSSGSGSSGGYMP